MKKLKKIFSLVLTTATLLSIALCAPFTVSAAAEQAITASSEVGAGNTIMFDTRSSGWKNFRTVYCHIWRADGTGTWPVWQAKAEKCTLDMESGIATYDLSKTGNIISKSDGKIYCVVFSADTGMQTYNAIMSGNCIGDTLYCTGNKLESPEDSERTAIEATWRNNPDCGPARKITSTGKVVGSAFPDGQNNATMMAEYLIQYYADPAKTAHTKELMETLNLDAETVMGAVQDKLAATANPDSDNIKKKISAILEKAANEDFTDGEYTYIIFESPNAGIGITGYNGNAADLTIPSEINGYAVIAIGAEAFCGCTSLTSVTIPDSVTSIGESAFSKCTSLKSVTIGDGVTEIEKNAFGDCKSLTSVTIPGSVTKIGYWAFFGCNSLKDIYYSKSIEDWNSIAIEMGNNVLKKAELHLNGDVNQDLLGDINNDGEINILDATMVQKHAAELEILDDNQCTRADVNGDGAIDILDATLIQKFSAELIEKLQ